MSMPDEAIEREPGVDSDNPWPGLNSYREEDASFFSGRESAVDSLFNQVVSQRVTVLFGSSGLGKTSMLCAGLFPCLRQNNGWPVRIRVAYNSPEQDFTEQVKEQIEEEAVATGIEVPWDKESKESLWELFHRKDSDFWSARNRLLMPVLVFDQFEELFTLGSRTPTSSAAVDRFIDALGTLTEGHTPAQIRESLVDSAEKARLYRFNEHAYRVVISLREDFLPELESLQHRLPSLAFNRFRLLPMTGSDALRVVQQGRQMVSSAVAERIVRFVSAAESRSADTPLDKLIVEPTLLSVMCSELNELRKRKTQNRITADLLTGHREQILSGFYERAIGKFPRQVREFVEERLLTVSGLRDSFAYENIVEKDGFSHDMINTLVNQRLLRIEERGGVKRVELSHDVLTGVISTSRDRRRLKESLEKVRKAESTPVAETMDPGQRTDEEKSLDDGWALCLSGGGFRGMLFHAGALWRLNEIGFLPRVDRLPAVSAGSIVAAVLGTNWHKLEFDEGTGVADNFEEEVIKPLRRLALENLDIKEYMLSLAGFSRIIEKVLSKKLFGTQTLQDLPDRPLIVIGATNLQSGALWRFSKPWMRDWRVGEIKRPTVRLATAVAASISVPPFPPVILKLKEQSFAADSGADLQHPPFTTQVHLADGSIYDNLALETAWKRYRNILVSDGLRGIQPEPIQKVGTLQSIARITDLIVSSMHSLRKRQLITSYVMGVRGGAYWGIHTHIKDYSLDNALPCPPERTNELAAIPARLKSLEPVFQKRLINWGYAVCDASIRKHVELDLSPPAGFPYPDTAV